MKNKFKMRFSCENGEHNSPMKIRGTLSFSQQKVIF